MQQTQTRQSYNHIMVSTWNRDKHDGHCTISWYSHGTETNTTVIVPYHGIHIVQGQIRKSLYHIMVSTWNRHKNEGHCTISWYPHGTDTNTTVIVPYHDIYMEQGQISWSLYYIIFTFYRERYDVHYIRDICARHRHPRTNK